MSPFQNPESSVHDSSVGHPFAASSVSSSLEVLPPGMDTSSPRKSVGLEVSDSGDGVSGQELSSRFESVSHFLSSSLDMTSSSDRSLDDLSASSTIVSSLGSGFVQTRSTTPAPSRAELTVVTASGLVFTTASAISRDANFAEAGRGSFDGSLHNLALNDSRNSLAHSSVIQGLVGLLMKGTSATPAPF